MSAPFQLNKKHTSPPNNRERERERERERVIKQETVGMLSNPR